MRGLTYQGVGWEYQGKGWEYQGEGWEYQGREVGAPNGGARSTQEERWFEYPRDEVDVPRRRD